MHLRQKVKVKERIKTKQSKRRTDQFLSKPADESKSPTFQITCSPPPNVLFPADCPRRRKDRSERLATLPAPLCFPSAPSKGVNITGILYSCGPAGSTVCSAALWHPELFHPSPVAFGQHELLIAQPQGRHCAMDVRAVLWGGVATPLEMKS